MGLLTTESAQPGLEGPERRLRTPGPSADREEGESKDVESHGPAAPPHCGGSARGPATGQAQGLRGTEKALASLQGLGFICEMKNSIYLAGLLRGAVVMCVPVCMRESVWCEAPAVYQHPAQSIIRPKRQCYCPH